MRTESNKPTPSSPAAADPSPSISLHGRILVAEDGRDNQRLLCTHLRHCGAEVIIAENGQIALDLAAKDSFDLILMDMQMPVMDGYTAVAELRRRGFKPAILALTACAKPEDQRKCRASGCTDCLSKPIELNIFLKTVSQYLAKAPKAAAGRLP